VAGPYKGEGNSIITTTGVLSDSARLTMRFLSYLSIILLNLHGTVAFPSYGSLARFSRSELEAIIPTLKEGVPETPPGPLNDTSAKLVNDKYHPWKPAGKNDIRGPCPGLNTLASHGVCRAIVRPNETGISCADDFVFNSGFLEMESLLPLRSSTPFKKVCH
jgi:hypothetical protein